MIFRKATQADISQIMLIYNEAKEYFKMNSIPQWQNNYPCLDTLKYDIENNIAYVLEDNCEIVATAAVLLFDETDYYDIEDGSWIDNKSYTAIHRIAARSRGTGMGTEIIRCVAQLILENGFSSIKIDTSSNNLPMQKMLKKNGFILRGNVRVREYSNPYFPDADTPFVQRLGFEKILK